MPTKLTTEEFINRARKVHGDKYDYSLVEYRKKDEKVKIICKKCGKTFEQTPNSHLYGTGCPYCKKSKGEERIIKWLDKNKVEYEREYSVFNENLFCENDILKIDFNLPQYNTFIEFNGGQHYFPVKHFGGEKKFQKQQARDIALRQYCREHKIKLIEIPYTNFNNIEEILKKELNIK